MTKEIKKSEMSPEEKLAQQIILDLKNDLLAMGINSTKIGEYINRLLELCLDISDHLDAEKGPKHFALLVLMNLRNNREKYEID